jgi:hypothetical protein
MAFTDNPLIASLGSELGLANLMGGNASLSPATQASPKMASKPNEPIYRDRPYIPRPMTPGQGSPGQGSMPQVPGGVMSLDTLQSPNVHDLLGTFGVSAPEGIDQHMFIHDPQAFANHPLIAGMLENGLQGLAYAQPGQNFFQSLMGGVRGMQDARAANIQNMNAQTMAPINQAMAVAQLQHAKNQNDLETAQQSYDQSRSKYYDDLYNNKDSLQQERLNSQQTIQGLKDQNQQLMQDPTKMLMRKAQDKAMQEIADQKYNGDQTKLTSKDLMNVLSGNVSNESVAKSAGARSVKQTRGAGTTGTGAMKITAGDRLDVQNIDNQSRQIQQELRSLQGNPGMALDETGNAIFGKDVDAYAGRLNQQLQQLQGRRNSIASKYGSAGTTTPTPQTTATRHYSKGNPFAP